MGIVQERISRIENLINKVRDHHMCLRFIDEGTSYMVLYPYGDWPVSGCRVWYEKDKYNALLKLIEKMDQHYNESLW